MTLTSWVGGFHGALHFPGAPSGRPHPEKGSLSTSGTRYQVPAWGEKRLSCVLSCGSLFSVGSLWPPCGRSYGSRGCRLIFFFFFFFLHGRGPWPEDDHHPNSAGLAPYEGGNLDYRSFTGIPAGEIPRLQSDPQLKTQLNRFSQAGTWYLVPEVDKEPFSGPTA